MSFNPNDYPRNSKNVQRQQVPNSGQRRPNYNRNNIPRPKQLVGNNAMASQKKTLIDEFRDAMIKTEHIDIGTYLVRDVIVPTIQNTILDYLSMKFFGTARFGRNTSMGYGRSIFDYGRNVINNYSSQYQYGNNQYGMNNNSTVDRARNRIDYREIVLLNAEDAKIIVDHMRGRIAKYGEATVSDLYDCLGITANNVDFDWGWNNPNDIGIKRVPEGWLIDVANAVYLAY